MNSVAAEQTRRFVEPLLERRRRVLEVGCGNGQLALVLATGGHEVTAIDVRPDGPLPSAPGLAFVAADLLHYEATPFDAIVCVASLHHISPAKRAVDAVLRLLAPGGVLVVDDFSVEVPDTATARWYFETQELLAAAGLSSVERIHGLPTEAPLTRWRNEHTHEGDPLVEGGAMRKAVGARMQMTVETGPYLYRYIASGIEEEAPPDSSLARRVALHLFESERRKIAEGSLAAVGLRLVAHRRSVACGARAVPPSGRPRSRGSGGLRVRRA